MVTPVGPFTGVMTDDDLAELQKRNGERLKEAIRELGSRYVFAGTRKPNDFGYYPVPLTSPERS